MNPANKSNNYHYNKSLKDLARKNRRNLNKSEASLWKYILGQKQMLGFQFRRQRPILKYIVDFVCFELMLIIEVDGLTHQFEDAIEADARRDEILKLVGFHTLRFSSWEVLNNMINVSELITKWVMDSGIELPPGNEDILNM